MRLIRTRLDDVAWMARSRWTKTITGGVLIAACATTTITYWNPLTSAFFDVTGITAPAEVAAREQLAEQKTLLASDVGSVREQYALVSRRDSLTKLTSEVKNRLAAWQALIENPQSTVEAVINARTAANTYIATMKNALKSDDAALAEARATAEAAANTAQQAQQTQQQTSNTQRAVNPPTSTGGGSPTTTDAQVTVNKSATCVVGVSTTVTFTANSAGNVSLNVSGAASGSSTGTGTASVTVILATGGTVSATATGIGTVNLSFSSLGAACS